MLARTRWRNFPKEARVHAFRTLALILMYPMTSRSLSSRLKRIVGIWFVVQIVLPFTAPLHVCGLRDLLHIPYDAANQVMPLSEGASDTESFTSPFDGAALRASASLVTVPEDFTSGPHLTPFDLSPSPQSQPAVLRV